MKISTKVRYGARLMLELALNYTNGHMSLQEIAEREEMSEKYLEHLVAALKAAGLVRGVRGRGGGYALVRPPSDVTLSEIYAAFEGSLSPVECVDDPAICEREPLCVTRDIWKDLTRAMSRVLASTTLQDLVDRRHQNLNEAGQPMYYI